MLPDDASQSSDDTAPDDPSTPPPSAEPSAELRGPGAPDERPLLPARLTPFAPPDPAAERRTTERLRMMTFSQLRSRRDRIDKRLFELGLSVGEEALKVPSVRGTGLLDLDRILRKLDALELAGEHARLEREVDRPEGSTEGLLGNITQELDWLGDVFRAREIRARRQLLASELGLALCAADLRVVGEYAPHVKRLLDEHLQSARRIDELFVEMRLVDDEFDRRAREGHTDDPPREIDALIARALDSVDDVSSKVGDTLVELGKSAAKGAARGGGQAVWGLARGAVSLGTRTLKRAPRGEDAADERPAEAFTDPRSRPRAGRTAELVSSEPRALPSPAKADVPELIRKLALLRDEGILSEAEFQQKKRELLDRL